MARMMRFTAAFLAIAAAGGCASAPAPLPNFIFSLTAWASGPEIEFLLLNVTQQRVKASDDIVGALALEVRDDSGAPVTSGMIRYQPTQAAPQARGAKALGPNKVFRKRLSTDALVQRIEAEMSAPLDRTRRYSVRFETLTPVVGPQSEVVIATVRSRSACTISFAGAKARTDCGSG